MGSGMIKMQKCASYRTSGDSVVAPIGSPSVIPDPPHLMSWTQHSAGNVLVKSSPATRAKTLS